VTPGGFNAARSAAPEIGRKGRTTAPRGIGYGRVSAPRLQATAKIIDGQLVMKLRNLDLERGFAGTANITLSDDRNSNEITPMQFNLPPDTEMDLPINQPVSQVENWMLMVFDDGGALQLMRGATVGQSKPQVQPQVQNAQVADAELNPPQYVTGVYDTTNVAPQPQSQGLVPIGELEGAPAEVSSGTGQTGAPPNSISNGDAPSQLTVTPRQIAATTENVTLEFDIASPNPLQYISVTVAAGDYRDTRQALMSTTRGRVPFLIPALYATATFIYEIKDESGRVLAGGVGDFRQLAGGK